MLGILIYWILDLQNTIQSIVEQPRLKIGQNLLTNRSKNWWHILWMLPYLYFTKKMNAWQRWCCAVGTWQFCLCKFDAWKSTSRYSLICTWVHFSENQRNGTLCTCSRTRYEWHSFSMITDLAQTSFRDFFFCGHPITPFFFSSSYIHIPRTINNRLHLVLLLFLDQYSQGSIENFCNFHKVFYFPVGNKLFVFWL